VHGTKTGWILDILHLLSKSTETWAGNDMKEFWICFVPLFVAVDAIGVLPIYINLSEGVPNKRRNVVVIQSVFTAMAVAAAFLLVGRPLLALLGITVADFMVAGGLLLFVLSLGDLLNPEKSRKKVDADAIGAVPIGVPLITGPAVLTTCLLLVGQHGVQMTMAAMVVNVLLAGFIFMFASPITRFLGHAGTRTMSKIASLLLASIAVMMVRKGIALIVLGS
jgi:multiple antibiotic resistance protein